MLLTQSCDLVFATRNSFKPENPPGLQGATVTTMPDMNLLDLLQQLGIPVCSEAGSLLQPRVITGTADSNQPTQIR
jgi:hypothetical protein